MRFITKTQTQPAVARMKGQDYIFEFAGKEFFSSDKDILSKNFKIIGNRLAESDILDEEILLLTYLDYEHPTHEEIEIVEEHNAEIFGKPILVERFTIEMARYYAKTHIYVLLKNEAGNITIRFRDSLLFGLIKFESDQFQIYL